MALHTGTMKCLHKCNKYCNTFTVKAGLLHKKTIFTIILLKLLCYKMSCAIFKIGTEDHERQIFLCFCK